MFEFLISVHIFVVLLAFCSCYWFLFLQIHLYGTSLGGFLAQLFAQHRPRRVRSLILSNTFLETRSFASAMPWAPVYVVIMFPFLLSLFLTALNFSELYQYFYLMCSLQSCVNFALSKIVLIFVLFLQCKLDPIFSSEKVCLNWNSRWSSWTIYCRFSGFCCFSGRVYEAHLWSHLSCASMMPWNNLFRLIEVLLVLEVTLEFYINFVQ